MGEMDSVPYYKNDVLIDTRLEIELDDFGTCTNYNYRDKTKKEVKPKESYEKYLLRRWKQKKGK